jgi:GNAT superfamily N-acetyltransferase
VRTFVLRPSVAADTDFVCGLITMTMRAHLENSGQRWAPDRVREHCEKEAAAGTIQIIALAATDVGALMYETRPSELWLDGLYLLPTCQGKGIGSTIAQDLIALARAQNVPVRLQVFKANPARRFWERLGFRVIGEDAYAYLLQSAV